MTKYRFDAEQISQHVIKYGLEVRPGIQLDPDRPALQDHANWLIGQYSGMFETLLSGPRQFRINKTFALPDGRMVEFPTFALTAKGLLYAFPRRLFIGRRHDMETRASDEVLLAAINDIKARLTGRSLFRMAVIHELVVDTGPTNSVELICTQFKNANWQQGLTNARIQLEISRTGKSVNLEIKPTYLSRMGQQAIPQEQARYGVLVGAEITTTPSKEGMTQAQTEDLLAFSNYYIPKELIGFLNGEQAHARSQE